MKFRYGKIFTLGFGFFIITLSWSLYNAYIPIFLQTYIKSVFVVGFIMTLDNIAAITLQPFFGAQSDRTNTRFGRRMPYLLIGVPLSALFFILIPLGYFHSLAMLIIVILFFNTIMSVYRAPTVALMPDLTPRALRSKANGIINLMGGLGAVLAFMVGAQLYGINQALPFQITGILMILIIAIMYFVVKEPERIEASRENKSMGIIEGLIFIIKEKDKSALFLLLAILSWFIGYGAVETFFTSYGKFYLGIEENAAAFILGFFSISFLIFAIPSGILATKIGRKKTILIGIVGLMVVFLSMVLITNVAVIRILMLIGGIFWAFVNINSYPMVVEMTTEENTGVYTGLYYFYASMAAIISPPLYGLIKDLTGYHTLFIFSFVFYLLAFIFILKVKRGEVT